MCTEKSFGCSWSTVQNSKEMRSVFKKQYPLIAH